MLESQSWKNKIAAKIWRLKRWWYLPKLLAITITSFNFFNCPVKSSRNLKLKFWSKFNNGFTNHGCLHHVFRKILYNFKIKRAHGARDNQFFFQNIHDNEIFQIFKMFKINCWINVYYTKSKRLDYLFCFQLKIPFFDKSGPKTQNYQFKMKFFTYNPFHNILRPFDVLPIFFSSQVKW